MSDRLSLIFDTITDGLITYDSAGTIASCNRAAQSLLRFAFEPGATLDIRQLLGPDFDPFSDIDAPQEIEAIDSIGLHRHLEVDIKQVAGDQRALRLVRIRDLTEIKLAQNRLDEQAFLIEKVHAFVVIVNAEGIIEWCNPHLELLLGFKKPEIIGRDSKEYLLNEGIPSEARRAIVRAIRKKRRFGEEVLLQHKNGRPIWAKVEGYPMQAGTGPPGRFIIMGVDITARKREEQMQFDFCSMVSHELRTPLTVISGALEVMGALENESDAASRVELLEMCQRNCRQLSVLVEDILDVNQLDAGGVKLRSEIVDVLDPLNETLKVVAPIAAKAGIGIDSTGATPVGEIFADSQRLQQIFTNLLTNAIKFSPLGSTIQVRTALVGQSVRVSISDSGAGIPIAFRPHIFDKFSRAAAVQASGKEGFGLGLSICKGFVEQMRGTIGYTSTNGEGTTFFVDFPKLQK
ncbi:MAG: ATP-binding protein [Burkholderiaceae bacterium]